jgi:hypothetical protein
MVRITSSGFTNALSNESTAATTIAVNPPSTLTPGNMYAAMTTASAVIISRMKKTHDKNKVIILRV